MNFNSASYVYQAVPPYMNNRELPSLMMADIIKREKVLRPEAPAEEIWAAAAVEVEEKCEMAWFGLTAVSMPETDVLDRAIAALYSDHARDKASELEAAKRIEQIKKHVHSINIKIAGERVTDFDTFYKQAPKEVVRWVCDAVHSTIVMSHAERKNFMPGSYSAA